MDQLSEKKKELEEKIVEIMITALEQDKISESTMAQMSAYVLDGIDAIQNMQEVTPFLKKLVERYDVFKPLLILEQTTLQDKIEDEVAQGVLVLLEHGKIENAIKLARSVTHKDSYQSTN